MADLVIGFLTERLLTTASSLAADEISLIFGVEEQLKNLAEKLEMIQALLSDAHSKQQTNQSVQLWLKKLKSVARDAEIVLDDFGYEVLREKIHFRKRDKVKDFLSPSNIFWFRSKSAGNIKDVLSSLEEVYAESNRIGLRPAELVNSLPDLREKRFSEPYVDDSEIVGRIDDTSKVIGMLIGSEYERNLPVITIIGMGGQGKTTLAQLIYKNDKVVTYFEKTVWICVSDDFSVERLLAEILQSLTGSSCQLSHTEALVNRLQELLRDKRYLLVLDDVWNEDRDKWERMRRCLWGIGGSKGSKVLATTRNEEVASTMRTSESHRLQTLSDDESLTLFEKCVFGEGGATKTPQLVNIGKRILKRCGGVPLAIKAIGGLLYSKNSESEWSIIERSEMWNLPIGGNGVLSAIKLSYDHLPSLSLKQCFAYCAIFKKDTVLEKDKLVQLWMAQGFLNLAKGSHLHMEDMGSIYFNILLKSSLLQDSRKDGKNNITHCKMHDLVHDLSLQVSESYCVDIDKDWKAVNQEIEAMRLSMVNSFGKRPLKRLKDIVPTKLRSLHLRGRGVLVDFVVNFQCLTVLIVIDWDAVELPDAICKIKHLRFLDICETSIRRLPKSFTELYYLQSLRVGHLDEVPKGFGNLINLRHLYVRDEGQNYCLLPGLGQLTNLQTLPFFKVDKSSGCQIEELEHLDNLKGELRIFGLENVSNHESALKSKLSQRSSIHSLELHWDTRRHDCDDTDVMEGLKPHSNLKSLKIVGYQSPKLPSWLVMEAKNDLIQLRNLVKLTLQDLDTCERLPSLGDLPCLEYLEIRGLRNVKCIGKEFYGWSNLDWESKSSGNNGGAEITLFPALKELQFRDMDSLEEWSDAIIPTHDSTAKVFPSLEEMNIWGLPKLSVFPNLGSLPCLRILRVWNCQNLSISPSWSWNSCSDEIRAAAALIQSSSDVDVEGTSSSCLDYVNINSDIHSQLQSLRELDIRNCDKLVAPFCSLKILAPVLKELTIWGNSSFWPKDLHHLTSLESLWLDGRNNEEIDCCFPWPYSISCPSSTTPSLTSLTLIGRPDVTSLPHEIQYVTTLRTLRIRNFEGLEGLPEWLGSLECLERLDIRKCEKLKQLPSAEALTNLKYLFISECHLLKKRCTKGINGSEWFKIAHIPNVEVDGERWCAGRTDHSIHN